MGLAGLINAAIIAVFFTILFAFRFKNRIPWNTILMFFVILFLGMWAASLWIRPFGPEMMGIAWVPIFFAGLIIALILAASIPPQEPREYHRKPGSDMPSENSPGIIGIRAFFWVLVIILIVAILSGMYFW